MNQKDRSLSRKRPINPNTIIDSWIGVYDMFFCILNSNDFHHHFWMFGVFPLLMVILFVVGALVVTLLVWIVLYAPRRRPERQYNEKIWKRLLNQLYNLIWLTQRLVWQAKYGKRRILSSSLHFSSSTCLYITVL